jgi:hypothetical protein
MFWVPAENQPRNKDTLKPGDGECRRRAPNGGGITAYFSKAAVAKPERMIAIVYPWPLSHGSDWCGV